MLVSDICIVLGLLSMACAGVLAASELVHFLQGAFGALVSASQVSSKKGSGKPSLKRHVPRTSSPAPPQPVNLSRARTLFMLGVGLVFMGLLLRAFFAVWAPSVSESDAVDPDLSFSFLTVAAFAVFVVVWGLSRLFAAGLGKEIEKGMQRVAIASLLVALFSFALDLHNSLKKKTPEPPKDIHLITAIVPKTDRVAFSQLPSLPPFESGEIRFTPALQEAVCLLRQTARQPDSSAVVVVGRHDQSELLPSAKRRFFSNAGLALQRAQAVHEALVKPGACPAPPLENVISLHSGPNHIGPMVLAPDLTDDRQVQVYHLRRLP